MTTGDTEYRDLLPGGSPRPGRGMTGLPCIACGRTDPCPDCRHHNHIPGWDEPMLPLDEDQEED